MRIVVREGFSYDLADALIDDLEEATAYLAAHPPGDGEAKVGFSHT
jgi:hypothetical protein